MRFFHPTIASIAVPLITASLATAYLAASAPQDPSADNRQQRSAQDPQGAPGDQNQPRVLATQLIDRELDTRDGTRCEVYDLVFDPSNHEIAYALVQREGDDKYRAVSLPSIRVYTSGNDDDRVSLRLKDGRLDQWPSIGEGELELAKTRDFARKVSRHDHTAAPRPGPDSQRIEPTEPDPSPWRSQRGELILVSELFGRSILDVDEDSIGELENLAIDSETGRVPFVVAGTGGFLGINETLRAVPVNRLTVSQIDDESDVLSNIHSSGVDRLPKFDRDELGTPRDRSTAEVADNWSSQGVWIGEVWTIYTAPPMPWALTEPEPVRLPLQVEDGQTHRFAVDVSVTDRSPQNLTQGRGDGQQGDGQQDDRYNRRSSGSTNRNESEANNDRPRRAEYELTFGEEERDGSRRLDVVVTWKGHWAGPTAGPQVDADPLVEASADQSRSGRSDRDSGMADKAWQGGGATRGFTVVVEPDSSIASFDPVENAEGEYWARQDDVDQSRSTPLHRDRVRSHLELILGAGLHNRTLRVGEHYSCSSREMLDGSFCLAYAGRTPEDEHGQASIDRMVNMDPPAAKFHIVKHDSGATDRDRANRNSMSDPRASHDDRSARVEDQGDQQQQRDRATRHGYGQDWGGTSLYSLEDGMLNVLVAHKSKSGQSTTVRIERRDEPFQSEGMNSNR